MQIVALGDNLHKNANAYFLGKINKKVITLSSAELALIVVKINEYMVIILGLLLPSSSSSSSSYSSPSSFTNKNVVMGTPSNKCP